MYNYFINKMHHNTFRNKEMDSAKAKTVFNFKSGIIFSLVGKIII